LGVVFWDAPKNNTVPPKTFWAPPRVKPFDAQKLFGGTLLDAQKTTGYRQDGRRPFLDAELGLLTFQDGCTAFQDGCRTWALKQLYAQKLVGRPPVLTPLDAQKLFGGTILDAQKTAGYRQKLFGGPPVLNHWTPKKHFGRRFLGRPKNNRVPPNTFWASQHVINYDFLCWIMMMMMDDEG
jgi:hypothetical protein